MHEGSGLKTLKGPSRKEYDGLVETLQIASQNLRRYVHNYGTKGEFEVAKELDNQIDNHIEYLNDYANGHYTTEEDKPE